MIDQVNQAIEEYQTKWQALVDARKDRELFERVRPNAVGWKTQDLADFNKCFAELRDHCNQVHLVWLNDRWVATMILRGAKLAWDIQIIKLMQRRPNSTDPIGLDHVDFYAPDIGNADIMQAKEPDLKWSDEANGLCQWTSIWFEGTEAKMRREGVIDVAIKELSAANERTLGKKV